MAPRRDTAAREPCIGFIAPINKVFAGWSPTTLPPDWADYRDRWERWHAVIAAVKLAAFGSLDIGVQRR